MHWMNQRKFDFLLNMIEVGIYPFDYIDLSGYELSNADLRLLLAKLEQSRAIKTKIRTINLSNNNLNAAIFEDFPILSTVVLTKNRLTMLRFSNTPAIKKLHVALNVLNSIGGLKDLSQLVSLDIYGNRFPNLILPTSPLVELDARRNIITSLDLSNIESLETARIEANPMQSLLIVGSPLNNHFSYSDLALDDASKLQIANHRNSLPALASIFNVDFNNTLAVYNPHNILTEDKLRDYFKAIFCQKRRYFNAMLGQSRVVYGMLAMNVPANMELKLIQALTFDYLHGNILDYVNSFFNALHKTDTPENIEHNMLVSNFMETTLKILVTEKITKAKSLFFTPALEKALLHRSPARNLELAKDKNLLETNPLLFAFNAAYFKGGELFSSLRSQISKISEPRPSL